jgi:hypothetical protein
LIGINTEEEMFTMLKRTFSIVVLVAIAFALVGIAPVPTEAQATNWPNANLLPAETALYFDIRFADYEKTLKFVLDTIEKVTGTRPANIYDQLNQGLQVLGREVTVEKDILPWIGDHITVAMVITDEQLKQFETDRASAMLALSNPNILALVAVKNDAAASKFIEEAIAKAPAALQTTTDTIGANKATIYKESGPCESRKNCGTLVVTKGFIAGGTSGAIDNLLTSLKTKKATLAQNANFEKMMKTLKPNNLFTLYIAPRLFQLQIAMTQAMMRSMPSILATQPAGGAATPDASAQNMELLKAALGAINGTAMGAYMDNKVLGLDFVQSVNMEALIKLYKDLGLSENVLKNLTPKAIESKLASQIPAKALAAVISSGLPQLYEGLKEGLSISGKMMEGMMPGMGRMPRGGMPDFQDIQRGFEQFEAALKVAFDLDLRQDVFSWMSGEFALYMLYNPGGSLAKMPNGQTWPFDHTLLFQTSDAAKTKSFLTKLNAGIEKTAKLKPTSAGQDLYQVEPSNGPAIAYGLVGNTFLVTTGSGLSATSAAIKGDGVMSNDAAWKKALTTMIKPTSQVWFINFTQITPLVKSIVALQNDQRASTKQGLAFLDLLESASISGGVMTPDGTSVASMQIVLK